MTIYEHLQRVPQRMAARVETITRVAAINAEFNELRSRIVDALTHYHETTGNRPDTLAGNQAMRLRFAGLTDIPPPADHPRSIVLGEYLLRLELVSNHPDGEFIVCEWHNLAMSLAKAGKDCWDVGLEASII